MVTEWKCDDKRMRATVDAEIQTILSSMYERGVRLWVDKGRLFYRARRGMLEAGQLEMLKSRKTDILASLVAAQESEGTLTVRSRPVGTLVPLSLQQEWFWNLTKHARTWNYFVTSALRLRGVLNVEALQKSVATVIQRHESLRTKIVVSGGRPWQQIRQSDNDALEIIKLAACCEVEACREARARVEAIFRRRLDMEVDALFHRALIRLSNHDHVLVVAIHHITTDAISFVHFFRELWALYAAFAGGYEPALPAVPAQYSDYTIWQREHCANWTEKCGRYWERRLAASRPIRWPTNTDTGDVRSFEPGSTTISMSYDLSLQFRRLAQVERVPMAMVVLSVFCALIAERCAQKDFVVPFAFDGRQHQQHFDIMGCFIHPLLLRVELSGNETILDLLRFVTERFFEACEYSDFGVGAIRRPDLTGGAFVQWISWQPTELTGVPDAAVWGDCGKLLTVEPFSVQEQVPEGSTTEVGLAAFFEDRSTGIHVEVVYRADLFSPETMKSISRDWMRISESAMRAPSDRIAFAGDV